MPNNQQQKSEFNKDFRSWAERSTFHGLPQIISSERIAVKVIWSVCLLASWSYCGKLLVNSVSDYWNYDVNTVVEILRDTDANFPTITFCTLHTCGLEAYKIDALLAAYRNRTNNPHAASINSSTTTNLKSIFKLMGEEYLRTSSRESLDQVFKANKTSIKVNSSFFFIQN